MKMEGVCFFCCQPSKDLLDKKEDELLKKFFKFLNRHLNYRESSKKKERIENQTKTNIYADVVSCKNCLKIVKSFCDLYHDLKTIELLLNWQLWTLIENMKSASKTDNLTVSKEPGKSQNKSILKLQTNLTKKCSYKLTSSYPQIVLKHPAGFEKDKVTDQDKCLNNPSTNFTENDEENVHGISEFPKNFNSTKKSTSTEDEGPEMVEHNYKITCPIESEDSSLSFSSRKENDVKLGNNCKRDLEGENVNDQIGNDGEENDQSLISSKNSSKSHIENLTTVKTIIKFEPEIHIFDTPEHRTPEKELINECAAVLRKIEKIEHPSASTGDTTLLSPLSQNEEVVQAEEVATSRRRLRTVHKCTTCDKTFSTLQSLHIHLEDSGCLDNVEEVESEVDEEVDEVEPDDNYLNTTSEEESEEDGDDESVHSDCADEAKDIKPQQKEGEPETVKKKKYKRKIDVESENNSKENNKKEFLIVKNKKGRWQCCFCNKSYPPNGKLRMHMLSKHPTKWKLAKFPRKQNVKSCYRFKCPSCDELFEKPHLLLIHWKKEHKMPQGPSTISVEIVSFTSNPNAQFFQSLHEDLKKPQHFVRVDIAVPEEILICEEGNCERPFYTKEGLEIHKTLHGTFLCGVSCSLTKSFLPELAVHEKKCDREKKTNPNDPKCSRCDFRFKDYSVYLRHYCSEHFSLKFIEHTCPICKTYLTDYENNNTSHVLFLHLQQFHSLDDSEVSKKEIFRCDQVNCTAYFLKLSSLDYHKVADHGLSKTEMKKVRGARKSVCETCGKAFRNDKDLGRHLLVHSGPESWDFTCKVCSKKCITENKLNEHMRTHTNEKPYVCEVCGAKYGHRHNLRIHVNSKHGDVVQDIPKRYNRNNLTSKKGIKRKASCDKGQSTENKSVRRKQKQSLNGLQETEAD